MSKFFENKPTLREICRISKLLDNKIEIGEHCNIWTGQQRGGYGILEIRFRGNKIKLGVHRVKYFFHNNCEPMTKEQHVSHLCHNKLCVKIEHLSLEPASINNNRQICKNEGECTGHYGYARCML